jgi:hypothetical protein
MDGPDDIPRHKASRMLTRSEINTFEHDVLSMSQILRTMRRNWSRMINAARSYNMSDDYHKLYDIQLLEERMQVLCRDLSLTEDGTEESSRPIDQLKWQLQRVSSLVIEAIECTNILKNLFTEQPQDIKETFNTVVANFQRLKGELQIEPITPQIEEIVSVVMRTLF